MNIDLLHWLHTDLEGETAVINLQQVDTLIYLSLTVPVW